MLIGCEEIFFDELITLWPNQFKQSARNWVENNVKGKINDLEIKPKDVEQAMEKWLWRYRDGGQFAKAK